MNSSTQSLIHQRLNCFINFIAPEREQDSKIKEHFLQIKEQVERHAKEEGYTIASIHYSGSYAKRTGLRRHVTGGSNVEGQDIDIAVILEDKSGKGQAINHSLIPDFKRYLKEHWEDHMVGHTKSSATLNIPKHKLSFDVVPLIKTEQSNIQKLIRTNREERTTSIQGHTEFIKKLNCQGTHVHFNNGLRLMKWWRYHQQMESKVFHNNRNSEKIPSFLLDLLCAKAYQETPKPESYSVMLYNWFRYLSQSINKLESIYFDKSFFLNDRETAIWKVIDPMDISNNVVEKWQPHKIRELAHWLQDGRNLMMQAIHFDNDGKTNESLNCLKKLFGPSIKQCK